MPTPVFSKPSYFDPTLDPGPRELAFASNAYSGSVTLSVQDPSGTAYTSLPGMSITVPPSNGRPVTIEWGGMFQQNAAGSGGLWTKLVSGGQDVALTRKRLPVDTGVTLDQSQIYDTIFGQAAIGVVTASTTYSVLASIIRASGASPTGVFLAFGPVPLTLRAFG